MPLMSGGCSDWISSGHQAMWGAAALLHVARPTWSNGRNTYVEPTGALKPLDAKKKKMFLQRFSGPNATQNLFGKARRTKSLPTTVSSLNHTRVLTDVSWSCSDFKTLAGWDVKVESVSSPTSPGPSTLTALWLGQSHCHFTGISCHLCSTEFLTDLHLLVNVEWWRKIGEHWWRKNSIYVEQDLHFWTSACVEEQCIIHETLFK